MLSATKAEHLLFRTQSHTAAPSTTTTHAAFRAPRLSCGDWTNLLCALIALAGVVLLLCVAHPVGRALVLVGGCGFVGGIVNAFFLHLLFHRLCGLQCLGAGVFLREANHVAIQLQRLIVQTFFMTDELKTYAKDHRPRSLEALVGDFLEQPQTHTALVNALTRVASMPNGIVVNSFAGMFGGIEAMVPRVTPLLLALAAEWDQQNPSPFERLQLLFGAVPPDVVAQRLSQEVGNMVHTRAMRLEPHEVAAMLHALVAPHLTWIVVWGNVWGLCVGGLIVLHDVVFLA
ncbi:Aste57867_12247 [Aphanomyces stellatus]|uniref:Aste57867_12247 protein n=1 Tax=Aphanomyces stellatus TaxID=120398 RepID=A0A485KVI2_9STRA|nr:hypothetical protein As57867_012202 [Aphanomyces stellatus]VFT89101.1 Aste57867_12247 [Aphanomyces stellatus]